MIQAIIEELLRSQGSGHHPPAQATTIPFSLRGLRGKKHNKRKGDGNHGFYSDHIILSTNKFKTSNGQVDW